MPVTPLYCEGGGQGTDARVLGAIVPPGCLVKPVGSKNGLGKKVLADRMISPSLAGFVDRDFDCASTTVTDQPIPLFEGTIQVGWSWERKEIENYLLDPTVIEKTWIPKNMFTLEAYQQALNQAAARLRFYTSARTALSCFRFSDRWGTRTNVFRANYKFPSDLEKQACITKIETIVRGDQAARVVTTGDVIQKFEALVDEFSSNGHRRNNPLIYHSGKDLLLALKPNLDQWLPNPQKSIEMFAERSVQQIEQAEDAYTWLPEWRALRETFGTQSFTSEHVAEA